MDKESYSKAEIDEIIAFNRRLLGKRRSESEVDRKVLDHIVEKVNSINHDDQRIRIIKKATRLLGGITFRQPFFDGNKETALAITIDFLNQNGFDLPIEPGNKIGEIYDILMKIEFGKGDDALYLELEDFLLKKVVIL